MTEHEDWTAWFQENYGEYPNYSELLDKLASTPSERRAILHSFIEPRESDEARRPTKAHHAVAKLAAEGAIRLILTTNFDRLIENALREAGVEPLVIASEDALAGATPVVHARCTVIKLHGDYQDARIKNTDAELAGYAPAIDGLLDEIFDRFGLIVVGWSGEWDAALRAALLRAPSRRYPFYWAARGQIGPLGQDLIDHRAGRSIAITDADSFFARLCDTVDALRQAARPHPQSVAMAVSLAKKYCRDDRYALEWAEMLTGEVAKIKSFINSTDYPTQQLTAKSLNALVKKFAALSEVLRRVCLVCGRWGTLKANQAIAQTVRSLWFRSHPLAGITYLSDLRDFCASCCFYWALAGEVVREDFFAVFHLMHGQIKNNGVNQALVSVLPVWGLVTDIDWRQLDGFERRRTPANDYLFTLFKDELCDAAIDEDNAEELFDRVELLISLEACHIRLLEIAANKRSWLWVPLGRYMWKRGGVAERLAEYDDLDNDRPLLQAGLLGGSPTSAKQTLDRMRKYFAENPSLTF
ncbi:SIR2 family protein [Methylocapsa palsarum]|uniref:SIR2-like domain-containing protein n=1 Tax=Methylocapsa palsarum TaxID=1612308 RepID=A0A1I4CDS8_9HYPH|nr:SIR2 family protein [Methylocapsa palsarum]SFK79334.1 SIR2-like domain-containing protein [Methylocapsa palsarum]